MNSTLVNMDMLSDPDIMARCRQMLKSDGVMVLPGFATSEGLRLLKEEILSAPFNEATRVFTAWQDQGDERFPANHPRNHKFFSKTGFVGRKTLERTPRGLSMGIFREEKMLHFLRAVAGVKLFRSNDENGSCYSYRVQPDYTAPWHFDESPYTAIIYLQNGEGGEFELVPWSRPTLSKEDEEGHDIVRRVLMEGDRSRVRQVSAAPGTLVFFSGAYSLHRAAPISEGLRIGLVVTFGLTPDFANSATVQNNNEWDPAHHARKVLDSKL